MKDILLKKIHELNPSFKPSGVFSFMTSLMDKPDWAKDIISKGFPNKNAISPIQNSSKIVINETYIDTDGHEKDREKIVEIQKPDVLSQITVKKSDWKTLEMPNKTEKFVIDKKLSEQEIFNLKFGHKPEAMEDKCFWYVEDNKLYVHRSWTGICIYIIELNTNGQLNVIVNRDEEQYKNVDIEEDKNNVSILLDYWKQEKFNYYEQFLDETSTAISKMASQNDVVDQIVDKIIEYPDNKEFTIAQFAKELNVDEKDMFDLTNKVFDKLDEKNINITSQYKDAIVGLSYIPYIKNNKDSVN